MPDADIGMEELVEFIAKNLVDHPEDVRVTSEKRGRRVRITLSVAPDDMGRVIGRQGRVAEAIRNVVHVVAQKRGLFVDVDIR
nr:KH domain-containing protein [Ardenticatena sp.]